MTPTSNPHNTGVICTLETDKLNKVLMSACLLGKSVRYDGGALSVTGEVIEQWLAEGRVISVCPEVDAGMSIPRDPAEIQRGDGLDVLNGESDVVEKSGGKVTSDFLSGAFTALNLCNRHNIKVAVLAEFSPSCGSSSIYDGRFSGKKVPGMGVTAALLRQHGVQVFSQHGIVDANKAIHATSA